MKEKIITLIGIISLLFIKIDAQKYFYSREKKFLTENSTTIIIKGKQKASYKRIGNLLSDKIILFDTISLKDMALIKFTSFEGKIQNLNFVKSDNSIPYVSNYLKGGNVPYVLWRTSLCFQH